MDNQDRSRCAYNVGARTLTSVLPQYGPSSFGAFAGTPEQRARIALRCCVPALGRMPLVLLHNDPMLEFGLCHMAARIKVPVTLAGPLSRNAPISTYDPLYGLDDQGVMEALGVADDADLASLVRDYLRVMDTMHSMEGSSELMGAAPYSLPLLQRLSRLDCERLEAEVLLRLPQTAQDELVARMTEPGNPRKVANLADALDTRLGSLLRPQAAPALATTQPPVSICSTALMGGLICIGLPSRSESALEQVAIELNYLLRYGKRLMLVISGTDVSDSALAELVLSQQSEGPLVVGLACDLATRVVKSTDEVGGLLANLATALILSCPNSEVASTFTKTFGTYERKATERGRHYSRELFDIIPRIDKGTNERLITEENVRPETLVGKPKRALVCGKNTPVPLIVDRFEEGR